MDDGDQDEVKRKYVQGMYSGLFAADMCREGSFDRRGYHNGQPTSQSSDECGQTHR